MNKSDPELEKSLIEYQNLERQLQNIILQKHNLQLQVNEVTLAQDELKRATDGELYKSVGSVMIRTTKEDADKDLKEKKDLANLRLNTFAKQEEKLRSHMQVIQAKLEQKLKGQVPDEGA